MSILFLACLLAICLPILSVQLPSLLSHFQPTRSIKVTEKRSTLHQRSPPLRRRLRPGRSTPASRSSTQLGGREATDGADSGARSSEGEETGSEEIHRQPMRIGSEGLLRVEGKGKGRADGRQAGRKPWDPPFPGTGRRSMRSERFGVPLTPPKKTGKELEEKGVAIRLFPPDGDGQYTYDQELKDKILESDREATPWPTHISAAATQDPAYDIVSEPSSQKKKSKPKPKPSAMSALWICIAMLAFLLFILAFAVLVAHSLAWFLVYKTEARLGEARRGIMQGGEMRLCLCAA